MSKKIHLNKSDSLKDIVDQIVNSESDIITLIVPNFSKLAEVESNFKVLKKLSEATDKKVAVESVDERVVKLAKAVDLEASNPFFAQNRPKKWQDTEERIFPELDGGDGENNAVLVSEKKKRRFFFRKKYFISALFLFLFGVPSFWVATNVLPSATIQIITQKSDWSFNDLVSVKKDGDIPSETFSQKKNAQMAFPATGKKVVNKKASGKLIVYNGYSSEPQKLVATTRFITNDDKILRLVKDIVVPGAKIVDGKITSSSIEADIVADKPGAEFNIASASDLKIPGFKGTPKYAAFYGEIKEPLKGGYSGAMAYPNDADIKTAKNKIAEVLEDSINSQLASQLPPNFKMVEGSKKFTLLKTEADPNVNQNNEFSIIAEGEMKVIGFKEKDVLVFMTDKMKSDKGQDFIFKNNDLKYGIANADFKNDAISLPIDFKAVVERPIDVNDFRRKIAGKSEIDLKTTISTLPGLASASVTLWPFYVKSVPEDANSARVKIEVK